MRFLILFFTFIFINSWAQELTLSLNIPADGTDPLNFRTVSELKISGSGQLTEEGFDKLLSLVPTDNKHLIIVDLREEPHGFLNGNAISWRDEKNWMNVGKTRDEIVANERERLNGLKKQHLAILYKKNETLPHPHFVARVQSEEEVVQSKGIRYVRLPVTDHVYPSEETMAEIVAFFKTLNPKDWVHFHCAAGRGRTTTLLTLFEIWHMAEKYTLDEILTKQHEIGGSPLKESSDIDWKQPLAEGRLQLIKDFYDFCHQHPNRQGDWLTWRSSRISPKAV